jgi:hypothetical protein
MDPILLKHTTWTSKEIGMKSQLEISANLNILLGEGASVLSPKELVQKLEEISKIDSVRLYLDISGSMKMYEEPTIVAAKAFLMTLPVDTPVKICTFDNEVHTVVDCAKMPEADSEERKNMLLALESIKNTGGNTNIFDVLNDAMKDGKVKNEKTVIAMITDGLATTGNLMGSKDLLDFAQGVSSHLTSSLLEKSKTNAANFYKRTFYSLGFQQKESDALNAELLTKLAKLTNGEFTLTKDPREFINFTASVRANILKIVHQLHVTAFSSNGMEGKSLFKSHDGFTLIADAATKIVFEWPEGAIGPFTFMVRGITFEKKDGTPAKFFVINHTLEDAQATKFEKISMAKRICGNSLENYTVTPELKIAIEKLVKETEDINDPKLALAFEAIKVAPPPGFKAPLHETGYSTRVSAYANNLTLGADDVMSPGVQCMQYDAQTAAVGGGGGGGGGGEANL